jgi:hypothetical protein
MHEAELSNSHAFNIRTPDCEAFNRFCDLLSLHSQSDVYDALRPETPQLAYFKELRIDKKALKARCKTM